MPLLVENVEAPVTRISYIETCLLRFVRRLFLAEVEQLLRNLQYRTEADVFPYEALLPTKCLRGMLPIPIGY